MAITSYIIHFLEALDETGNALLGKKKDIPEAGNPHYTMSQRWAYERQKGSKIACILCKILTWVFKPLYRNDPYYDHCSDAIKDFPPNLSDTG